MLGEETHEGINIKHISLPEVKKNVTGPFDIERDVPQSFWAHLMNDIDADLKRAQDVDITDTEEVYSAMSVLVELLAPLKVASPVRAARVDLRSLEEKFITTFDVLNNDNNFSELCTFVCNSLSLMPELRAKLPINDEFARKMERLLLNEDVMWSWAYVSNMVEYRQLFPDRPIQVPIHDSVSSLMELVQQFQQSPRYLAKTLAYIKLIDPEKIDDLLTSERWQMFHKQLPIDMSLSRCGEAVELIKNLSLLAAQHVEVTPNGLHLINQPVIAKETIPLPVVKAA